MYLNAQWVRARDGTRHLNAVLYRHDGTELPADLWSRPETEILGIVTTTHPGKRIAARLDTIPGGNDVECFLDVVGPDQTPLDAVGRTLDALRRTLQESGRSRERASSGGVLAEFSALLDDEHRAQRFEELCRAALDLYRDRRSPAWMAREPLTIRMATDESGLRFRLDASAEETLAAAGGERSRPRRSVCISSDVQDAFERVHGSIYPHVAEWLTGLSREELLDAGGVRFVAAERVVFWPARV